MTELAADAIGDDNIGVERILFGSDRPHGEGTAMPLDFAMEIGGLGESDRERTMCSSAQELHGSAG